METRTHEFTSNPDAIPEIHRNRGLGPELWQRILKKEKKAKRDNGRIANYAHSVVSGDIMDQNFAHRRGTFALGRNDWETIADETTGQTNLYAKLESSRIPTVRSEINDRLGNYHLEWNNVEGKWYTVIPAREEEIMGNAYDDVQFIKHSAVHEPAPGEHILNAFLFDNRSEGTIQTIPPDELFAQVGRMLARMDDTQLTDHLKRVEFPTYTAEVAVPLSFPAFKKIQPQVDALAEIVKIHYDDIIEATRTPPNGIVTVSRRTNKLIVPSLHVPITPAMRSGMLAGL